MNPSSTPSPDISALPYRDTKPQGAADFYFGINATFRFIKAQFGLQGLIAYWRDLGVDYYRPVWTRWKELGLPGIASYWHAFFDAEPGSNVKVHLLEFPGQRNEVRVEVKACPAIRHLREHGREIVPEFCQQCYYKNEAAAEEAGYTIRITGGNGACSQRFFRPTAEESLQDMEAIHRC